MRPARKAHWPHSIKLLPEVLRWPFNCIIRARPAWRERDELPRHCSHERSASNACTDAVAVFCLVDGPYGAFCTYRRDMRGGTRSAWTGTKG